MKKIFSFLCLIVAVTAMTSCSSAKEEKGTSGTGNAVLDNIFERKSVRAYLNKGVEKEKIRQLKIHLCFLKMMMFISMEKNESQQKMQMEHKLI